MQPIRAALPTGQRLLVAGGLCLLAALSPSPARATILLFDQTRDAATNSIVGPTTSGASLPGDYGDHVTGAVVAVPGGSFTYGEAGEGFTPDVTVDIYSSSATVTNPQVGLWQTGYGDLVNVVFGEGPGIEGSPFFFVRLTAEPGYVADLYGFDLAGYGSDYTINAVEIFADALSVFSQSNVLVEGDTSGTPHTTFAFTTPYSAADLILRLDLSNLPSSIQDNVGIDSIRFGQTPPGVPEPGTGLLLLSGLIGLGIARSTPLWGAPTR